TAGKLHLKGYAGNSGLGSETVVKLNTKGDINLAGKGVLIEGSDLSVGNKTNITATDGSVEVKGVKNSFSNKVSQHKLRTLKEQINDAKQELEKPFLDTKWLEEFQKEEKNWINYVAGTCYNSPYPGGVGQCVSIRAPNVAVAEKQMPSYYKLTKSTNYNKYMSYLSNQKSLKKTISDLTQIETASNTPSTGYEHKVSNIVAGKDINISAKQGVLIEGADISSSQGGINILAQGNLPSTSINDDNGTKTYKDSIRITGLADIYQQGDINKGSVTGPNYSYHQLINQPKLTAKGDIKIAGVGSLPKSTDTAINNSVVLNSADITSTNGDVRIDAAKGDINLEASQVAFLDGSQTKK
ncbi:hemagglutinin repeat-containing protein, partial [Psychrobacter phenylpyruvicus]|uniref:hemagglutinin repeat-containing protein n=1 Tax=Psychrobacter phenylpyruvicus TaxID=29432 RepID=UPI000A54488A